MTTPFSGLTAAQSLPLGGRAITLVEGSSFCISTQAGDILPGGAQGFFYRDLRLLSRWELLIDGQRTEPLSGCATHPFAGEFRINLTLRRAT